jgi:hypothetical protein
LQCATQKCDFKVERAAEQTACRSIRQHRHLMQDLLQQFDLGCCRSELSRGPCKSSLRRRAKVRCE